MPLKGGLVCAAVRQVRSLSSYSARGDLGPIDGVGPLFLSPCSDSSSPGNLVGTQFLSPEARGGLFIYILLMPIISPKYTLCPDSTLGLLGLCKALVFVFIF